jgi:hypothetical protein
VCVCHVWCVGREGASERVSERERGSEGARKEVERASEWDTKSVVKVFERASEWDMGSEGLQGDRNRCVYVCVCVCVCVHACVRDRQIDR